MGLSSFKVIKMAPFVDRSYHVRITTGLPL